MASQTLKADRDAYVDEASPDSNFGGGSRLYVRSQGGILGDGDRRVYVSFDLSQLPADAAELLTATLRLHPEEDSTLQRTLVCHEVTGAWTEGGITWNTQPATGTDHGTQTSNEDPQTWDVLSTAEAAFPGGRAELLVQDETEGSADGPEQAYVSREGVGAEPELVLTFKRQATGDLSSTVTPNNNRVADLLAQLAVRVDGDRYTGTRSVELRDAGGGSVEVDDLAYDVGRQALWGVDASREQVYRFSLDGAHEATYGLPAGFEGIGIAYTGTHLWVSDDVDQVLKKFSIGDEVLTEEDEVSTSLFLTKLAWDGERLWGADTIGQQVHKVNLNTGEASETHAVDDEPWGLVFPTDAADPFLLRVPADSKNAVLARHDATDLSVLATWPYPGESSFDNGIGLTLLRGRASDLLLTRKEGTAELVYIASLTLASQVTVGNLIGTGDLTATIQPGNIPASGELASQVLPGNGAQSDLATSLMPQPIATADLPASVQPSALSSSSDLTSTLRPSTTQVDVQARATGTVAPVIPVSADDFAEISGEIGSEVTHTRDGSSSSLRRVVQLIDTQTAKTFPREATSEQGRSSTQDKLGRGDAVLYAKQGDSFQPGDTVTYDGLTWTVVGTLGWETIGDERIYQEVGLRRVSVTATGRAKATVQRSQSVGLVSEVTVNVP